MKRFVEGLDRSQRTLFPETLEDFVAEDNAVHVIEAFVEGLVATAASARSFLALRGFLEANAIHTLIRQRPPTPSCRGQKPLLRREQ
jgi:hypothetical protein